MLQRSCFDSELKTTTSATLRRLQRKSNPERDDVLAGIRHATSLKECLIHTLTDSGNPDKRL